MYSDKQKPPYDISGEEKTGSKDVDKEDPVGGSSDKFFSDYNDNEDGIPDIIFNQPHRQSHQQHNHPGHNPQGHNHPGHNPQGHNHPGHNPQGHNHPGHNPQGHNHPGHNHPGHNPQAHNHPGHIPKVIVEESSPSKGATMGGIIGIIGVCVLLIFGVMFCYRYFSESEVISSPKSSDIVKIDSLNISPKLSLSRSQTPFTSLSKIASV